MEAPTTTETRTTHAFSPARIIALALIAVLAAGLAYLRSAPERVQVSVPAGAKAGDLIVKPGTYETEKGSYRADIGTLVVPENRNDPKSRLIALPVIRIRAKSDHPLEPIFRLEGGPGGTNMKFAAASRFADDHDVVLVGYRGVDGSVKLDGPEVAEALKHSRDFLSEGSLRAYGQAFAAAEKRLRAEGVDLAGYTMSAQADDLEAARVALGYGKVDLVSESAGTRLAMIYAWRHPDSIRRSVMIAVNPPGHFLWDPKMTDEQIGRYSRLYAEAGGRRDLAGTMRHTARHVPDRWLFLPIKKGNVKVASALAMFESTSKLGPFSAPPVLDAWLSAADGDPSGLWLSSVVANVMFPDMFTWGEYAAIGSADASAGLAAFSSGQQDRDSIFGTGHPATEFVWGGGSLAHAWHTNLDDVAYSRTQTSAVETLLIGGTLDMSTPPEVATDELLPYLPNGRQVVLAELGHSSSFWAEQPAGGTRLIDTFLDSGRVDESAYKPVTVDFKPDTTLTGLAKRILGVMVGVAALAVLSLVGMAVWVRKRGGFGPKTSAVLRSLYVPVLGLGGWLAGALVVLAVLPTVPLDDELLAVLSVGTATGLGAYWAWVRRGWFAATKTAGFVGVVSGALVGGWLGFHAAEGFVALATTVVGATLGANSLLILLDVVRERPSGRSRTAARPGRVDR